MDCSIEQKLIEFFSKYKLLKFKKGEIIYRAGEEIAQVSFVKNGYIRLFTESKGGKEITLNLFKPIFYLSLILSSKKKENKYFFEAITDVELWRAPYGDVDKFFRTQPEVTSWLNAKLLSVIEEILDNLEGVISGNSLSKIASLIISLANKFGVKKATGIEIDFQTTHKIIASLAGTTRETASIHIKRMENKGLLIQDHKKIIIPDLEKLNCLI